MRHNEDQPGARRMALEKLAGAKQAQAPEGGDIVGDITRVLEGRVTPETLDQIVRLVQAELGGGTAREPMSERKY